MTLPTRLWHKLFEPLDDNPSRYSLIRKSLFLAFILGLAVYSRPVSQTAEPRGTPHTLFDSIPIPDFGIGTTFPNIVPADGTTLATSIILVSPSDGFTGTVTLTDPSIPAALMCTAIDPSIITNLSGNARLSCSSEFAGTYNVTIVGTSNTITHNATATFRFASLRPPEFTISAFTPMTFATSSTATSNVTVTSLGGFDQQVNLTSTVYPSAGLSVSLIPQNFVRGSGTSKTTFSSSTPGDYTVTITGTGGSLSRTTTIIVTVTLTPTPDFAISASSNSINIAAGNSGTARITITSQNGFTGPVTLAVSAPGGVSCDLSNTSIQSSGESNLTCTCNIPGDYTVLIRASSGDSSRTTTVIAHVRASLPVAPTPSSIPTHSTWTFYIVAVLIVIIAASAATVLLLRKSRGAEVPNSQP